jgi:hypothetical protein
MSARGGPFNILTMTLNILAISDSQFFPRLKTLASSINKNMPTAMLHAYLVNMSDEEALAPLRALHPRTEVYFVEEALDAIEVKVALDGVTRFTEKAGFCVNLRAKAIHQLLLDGCDYLLFLDADSIVRRDLSPLVGMIDESDILIHKRDRPEEFMRVAAGVIAIKRNPRSIKFFEMLIRRIDELGDRTFFSDQLAFHRTALEAEGGVKISHLPIEYIDWEFSPESYIWTGKGQRKHESQTYRDEEKLYNPVNMREV